MIQFTWQQLGLWLLEGVAVWLPAMLFWTFSAKPLFEAAKVIWKANKK